MFVYRPLLGKGKLRRAGRYFPQVAVGVGEVAAVASPRRALRVLDDRSACTLRLGEDLVDTFSRPDVVGQRDAAEAGAVGRHFRVVRGSAPGIERKRRRAVAETEADPVVILLLDRPPEPLVVELPRALQVSDAERNDGYVRFHGLCFRLEYDDGRIRAPFRMNLVSPSRAERRD